MAEEESVGPAVGCVDDQQRREAVVDGGLRDRANSRRAPIKVVAVGKEPKQIADQRVDGAVGPLRGGDQDAGDGVAQVERWRRIAGLPGRWPARWRDGRNQRRQPRRFISCGGRVVGFADLNEGFWTGSADRIPFGVEGGWHGGGHGLFPQHGAKLGALSPPCIAQQPLGGPLKDDGLPAALATAPVRRGERPLWDEVSPVEPLQLRPLQDLRRQFGSVRLSRRLGKRPSTTNRPTQRRTGLRRDNRAVRSQSIRLRRPRRRECW